MLHGTPRLSQGIPARWAGAACDCIGRIVYSWRLGCRNALKGMVPAAFCGASGLASERDASVFGEMIVGSLFANFVRGRVNLGHKPDAVDNPTRGGRFDARQK